MLVFMCVFAALAAALRVQSKILPRISAAEKIQEISQTFYQRQVDGELLISAETRPSARRAKMIRLRRQHRFRGV